MRNYWMRIALGALAIFTVGMVARALITRGIGGVKGVVEGSGPITIPLAFIPFQLGADKLGTLERVTFDGWRYALKECADSRNIGNWKYFRRILERLEREGYQPSTAPASQPSTTLDFVLEDTYA